MTKKITEREQIIVRDLIAAGLIAHATDARGQPVYRDAKPVYRVTSKGRSDHEVKRYLDGVTRYLDGSRGRVSAAAGLPAESAKPWADHVILGLKNPAYHTRKVGSLSLAELQAVEDNWLPKVRAVWETVHPRQKADAEALPLP